MSTNSVKYLSGRVKKTPSNEVPTDRYEWLRLNDAEADLGVPSEDHSLAGSLIDGTREWIGRADLIAGNYAILSGTLTDRLVDSSDVTITVDADTADTANKVVARSATNSFGITTIDWTIPDSEAAIVEGRLQWNIDEATLDLGLENDIPLHIGQEVLYRVTNKSGSPINKGVLVCAIAQNPVGNSGRIPIEAWDGTQPVQTIMGVTAGAIADDDDGYAVHFGKVRKVNTDDFEEGDILYADPAGGTTGLTNVLPQAPNSKTIIALVITKSEQVGEIFVRPTLSDSLANDDLVQIIGTLSDNDVLVYNGSNSRFENESLTTDIVTEGSNLYFTEQRARDSVSAGGDLAYDSGTGVFSVTTYKSTDFDTDFSNKTTDQLTEGDNNLYFTTGRIDDHLSGGTGVTYAAGEISIGQPVGTTDDVTFNNITVDGIISSNLAVNGAITESTDNGQNYYPVVTQQDIGTGANQVPLNQFLGTMAYQNSDSVTVGDITVTGTAVFPPPEITMSDTAPSSPVPGNLWWDSVSGNLFVYYDDGTNSQWVNASSNVGASEEFLSDANLKKDVASIRDGLALVNQIEPREFRWIDNGEKAFGVIAQEIEEVLPEIVNQNPISGIRSVEYHQIIPFLVSAIQTLTKRIEQLESEQS